MILVTGGTGLVGSHLLYRLSKDNLNIKAIYRSKKSLEKVKQIFALYADNSDELFKKITWIQADLIDIPSLEHAFKDVTHVYHIAAFVSFKATDYDLMKKTNVDGTATIVNLSLSFKIKKLIYVSSIATLSPKPNETILTESSEWNPEYHHSDYAYTKQAAEMEVWRGSQEGLSIAMINPGIILGAGFWNEGSGKIFQKVKKGLSFYTDGIGGFVGVEDVCSVLILLMNSEPKGERYVLVAENWSYQKLLQTIAESLNVKPPTYQAKPWMSKFASMMGMIPRQSVRAVHSHKTYDSTKIKSSCNFEFHPLEKVIQDIGKKYK